MRFNATDLALLLTVAVGSGGCSASDSAAEIDADRVRALTLVEEVRSGSVDDPDAGFSNVGGVRVAADGRIFVLERQDRVVRVLGPDGSALGRIGRQGQGPGEFMSVNGFGLVGDTLWVMDQQSRRITLFSLAGDVLATVPATGIDLSAPVPNLRVNAYPAALRPDGLFSSSFNFMMMGGGGMPQQPFTVPLLLFDAGGAPIDTAGYYTYRPPPQVQVAGRSVSVASPLTTESLRLQDGSDTIVIERPVAQSSSIGAFTVLRVSNQDTVFRRQLSYQPLPVGDAVKDSLVRARISLPLRTFPPADTVAVRIAVESNMELPAFYPPVSTALVGANGSVWIRREDDGGDAWRWLVLDPDGEVRGLLTLPKAAVLEWADADRLWVVERDALGIPWVVRYRIAA